MNIETHFEFSSEEIEKAALKHVPDYMIGSFIAYVTEGRPPGHFLTAVLANDLMEAVARGDAENGNRLRGWVMLLHNFSPSGCYGSPEKVKEWINHDGFRGLIERMDQPTSPYLAQ